MIISRREAITANLTRYFTGLPCKWGHIAERQTIQGACIDCLRPKLTNAAAIAARDSKQRRTDIRVKMQRVAFGLPTEKMEFFELAVYAAACAVEPSLLLSDVRVGEPKVKFDGALTVTTFRILPQHQEQLRNLHRVLQSSK